MKTTKTVLLWLVIVVVAILFVQVIRAGKANPPPPEISYSGFISRVAQGQVSKVIITGSDVLGYDTTSGSFRVIVPPKSVGDA